MTRAAGALAAGGAVNPRLKSLAVTAGLSFWFYAIASPAGALKTCRLLRALGGGGEDGTHCLPLHEGAHDAVRRH